MNLKRSRRKIRTGWCFEAKSRGVFPNNRTKYMVSKMVSNSEILSYYLIFWKMSVWNFLLDDSILNIP